MLETLKKLLAEELQIDPETVTMDAELASDLGLNSIELADLVMLCEEKFGVTIDDDDIHKFVTIGDVVEYLEAQQ
ncbi:MAG: acyl carrier protein [Clostridia bacterium]|nr:acyl carrier protein [Clostridia bacterium]MBQ7910875.1 acyl carrier protein [Clostridia bacterium]